MFQHLRANTRYHVSMYNTKMESEWQDCQLREHSPLTDLPRGAIKPTKHPIPPLETVTCG